MDNIRIEPFRVPADSAIFQIRNDANGSSWAAGASVSNITFQNIYYTGTGELKSLLDGVGSGISGVNFNGLFKNGIAMTTQTESNIFDTVGNVTGVQVQ